MGSFKRNIYQTMRKYQEFFKMVHQDKERIRMPCIPPLIKSTSNLNSYIDIQYMDSEWYYYRLFRRHLSHAPRSIVFDSILLSVNQILLLRRAIAEPVIGCERSCHSPNSVTMHSLPHRKSRLTLRRMARNVPRTWIFVV